ncbi:MAG TPA: hypothetical protein VLU46_12960, partial [Thermoanaerobaculia bacterium]|nr:hypothetical protein [Thermoanaerobaculia bacterium]
TSIAMTVCMKRTILFSALSLILAAGCASTANQSMASSSAPGVQIHLGQVTQPADLYYFRGPINVQYQMQITNPTNMPLTLRSIRLDTIGSGAYRMRTGNSPMNYTIPPNSTVAVPLSAWAHAAGGFMRANEPVNIRAVATFESPNGSFVRQVNEYIPQ